MGLWTRSRATEHAESNGYDFGPADAGRMDFLQVEKNKMAKKVIGQVKLQIPAGKATPAPPVGPALGQHGVNIMDFCKSFNAKTSAKDQEGLIIPVVVTIYADRSYSFITKTPPASILLKRAANIAKGSGEPNKSKVGTVSQKQVEDIARLKLPTERGQPGSSDSNGKGHGPQHGN